MRRKADILSLTDKSLPTGNNGVLRRAIIDTVNTAIRAGKRINMHFPYYLLHISRSSGIITWLIYY